MMMVLALGMSSPLSMMLVQTSTSYSPSANASMTADSSFSGIWPWAMPIRASGTILRELGRDLLDALHAVVDEEHLPVAIHLAQDRLAHQRLVELTDEGLDGQALLGRRLDGAQVAHAGQAHVQRARDGRRRQGQHVHLGAHLLDALLVRHAEPLLLVHDQQPQILEGHVLAQQAVRADHQVHRCRLPAAQRRDPAARTSESARASRRVTGKAASRRQKLV